MNVLRLKISDNNLDQLVNYLIQARQFVYEKHGADVSILISDHFRLIDTTSHVNIVIMKKEGSFIYIDVISGGGDDGLLDFSKRVDKGYAQMAAEAIYDYAELYELKVEEL
jgi:hypothetical protein